MIKSGVLAIGLVGFAAVIIQYSPHPSPSNQAVSPPRIGAPTRLQIPSINVDAAVEHVSLTADGSMDVPKLQFNTAWYAPGPKPGETGSAVIAGHVDWKFGEKAVFTDLHRLKPGDQVVVRNEHGLDIPFIVRTSRIYDSNDYALDVFTSTDGLAHLNLITCQGDWNKSANTYSQRLIVFTDRVY